MLDWLIGKNKMEFVVHFSGKLANLNVNVARGGQEVLRDERNITLMFTLSGNVATRDTFQYVRKAEDLGSLHKMSWTLRQSTVPRNTYLFVTALCDTLTFFGEEGCTVWATAAIPLCDIAEGNVKSVHQLINTSAYDANKSASHIWHKADLQIHSLTCSKIKFADAPSLDVCFHTTMQIRERGQRLLHGMRPCVPKIGDYLLRVYPHGYIKGGKMPFSLALVGRPRDFPYFPTAEMYERMLDAALLIEDVQKADFVQCVRQQLAHKGAQFVCPFSACVAVVTRMLTVWMLATPYSFDFSSGGKSAPHHQYRMDRCGTVDDSVGEMNDQVVIFCCGGAVERLNGDCEDGAATLRVLKSGLDALLASGAPVSDALRCAHDLINMWVWVSNIGYCGDEGNEHDHQNDRGVCHAFVLGYSKAMFWRAVHKGCKSLLSAQGVSRQTAQSLTAAMGRIEKLLARFPPWLDALMTAKVETTNQMWGCGALAGCCDPDHPNVETVVHRDFETWETTLRGYVSVAPNVTNNWMFNSPGQHIEHQVPQFAARFVDRPDDNRLYYYLYVTMCTAFDDDDPDMRFVWGDDCVPLTYMYTNERGDRYGRVAQEVMLAPDRLVLRPHEMASRDEIEKLKVAAWDTAFPAYFKDNEPVECVVHQAADTPLFGDSDLRPYLVHGGEHRARGSLLVRPGYLTAEYKREFLSILHQGSMFDYWAIRVHEGRVLYKVTLYASTRRSYGRATLGRTKTSSLGWCSLSDETQGLWLKGMPWSAKNALVCEDWAATHIDSMHDEALRRWAVGNSMTVPAGQMPMWPPGCGTWELDTLVVEANGLICLPDAVFEIHGLRVLRVSNNKLREVPGSVARAVHLRTLDLTNNCLVSLPSALAKLSHLTDLTVSGNPLGRVPDVVFDLQRLETLCVENTHLVTLAGAWERASELKTLSASHNDTLASVSGSVGRATSLQRLDLSCCPKLRTLHPGVCRAPSLQMLIAHQTGLESLPDAIGGMQTLTACYVHHAQLRSLPKTLGDAPSLKQLYVQNNELGLVPDELGNAAALETLDVSNNHLRRVPDAIVNVRTLTNLNVSGNCGLSALPSELGSLSRLTVLNATATSIAALPESLVDIDHPMEIKVDRDDQWPEGLRERQAQLSVEQGALR
jgi:Leucine-rich repeat (LRR) protein